AGGAEEKWVESRSRRAHGRTPEEEAAASATPARPGQAEDEAAALDTRARAPRARPADARGRLVGDPLPRYRRWLRGLLDRGCAARGRRPGGLCTPDRARGRRRAHARA